MGRPKLILTVGGRTVIARVVTALREGGAAPVVVVAAPADAAGSLVLHSEARDAGAELVVPSSRPTDMRSSVEHGLIELERRGRVPETVLLVPADSPRVTPALVGLVIASASKNPEAVVVPVVGGKRGHPAAFPWPIALGVRRLPAGVGVNALLAIHAARVVEVDVSDAGALIDMDTPEDYERACRQGG